jgi:hypothetical protein
MRAVVMLVLACLSLRQGLQAQIKIAEGYTAPAPQQVAAHYDSSSDFVGAQYGQLLGEDIFLIDPGMSDSYFGFCPDRYFQCNYDEVYMASSADGYRTTPEKFLKGRTFTVVDIGPCNYPRHVILKLSDRATGEILYHRYSLDQHHLLSEFVVVGFYEKLKQRCIGKRFVAKREILGTFSRAPRDSVTIIPGEWWKCTDVVCVDSPFVYSVQLEYKSKTTRMSIFRSGADLLQEYFDPLTSADSSLALLLSAEMERWLTAIQEQGTGITDVEEDISPNKAGLELRIINTKQQPIKYVWFTIAARNSVNDVVARKVVHGTGPVETGKMELFRFKDIFYTPNIHRLEIEAIGVQYFDGTSSIIQGWEAIRNINFPYPFQLSSTIIGNLY